MPAAPIRYYHRYKQSVETEQVYGEKWLRLAYENPAGRFVVWLLARRAWFHFTAGKGRIFARFSAKEAGTNNPAVLHWKIRRTRNCKVGP